MIEISTVKKVTVTLTPEQAISNYWNYWKECECPDIFAEPDDTKFRSDSIGRLFNVIRLFTDRNIGNEETRANIISLFKDGLTASLINREALEAFYNREVVREIVIQLNQGSGAKFILIEHQNINL